ncbi:MAG TPA: Dabb family protein [Gemmatimonadales bacterium]|nr:Dabb family protein [Gemmatimonadales bacterium]
MIHHIVCFRFHPGTPEARIEAAGRALLGMAGVIPEVRRVHWGPNLAPSAGDYSHVLTVVVDDMAAVGRYLEHPVHVKIVTDTIAPIRAARLALDVEL